MDRQESTDVAIFWRTDGVAGTEASRRRVWTVQDLLPVSEGLVPGEQPSHWEARTAPVRFAISERLEAGWYQVRLAIRSFQRFTVQKRCELVFGKAEGGERPPARETFSWNRNFSEEFVVKLSRPAEGIRLELHNVEGTFAIESFAVASLSPLRVTALALREKMRLIRAYRCTGPVLWRGTKMLLRGRWREFGAKVLKGLIDGRQIRTGTGHADEVDAAWWRRHALTRDEAERIAHECDSWKDIIPIAVIVPVHPGRLELAQWAAHSVRRQIYPHWELYLVTAGPNGVTPHVHNLLPKDPRVHVIRVSPWMGLGFAMGKALAATECRWAVVLPPGVELAEHALYHWVKCLRENPSEEVVGARIDTGLAESNLEEKSSIASSCQQLLGPRKSEENTAAVGDTPPRAENSADQVPSLALRGGHGTSVLSLGPSHEPQGSAPTLGADSARRANCESATAAPKEGDGTERDLRYPSAVWAVSTRCLAQQMSWGLSVEKVAEWSEFWKTVPHRLLETVLAYPVEERPLMDHARVGRKPVSPHTPLFLSTDLKGISGYDHLSYAVLKGLPSAGVALRWHQVSAVTAELLPRGVRPPAGGWKPGDKQLIISPPFLFQRFQPDAASALYTMWETDYLEPEWVEVMNRCRLVIVPSHWGAECFRNCGVRVPIEVVPLGYDPVVFHPDDGSFPSVCTFGTAGALSAGGLRKNAQLVIDLFRRAFPHQQDVRLRVKITPQSPSLETYDDPRIDVIRAILPVTQVARWYRSLTVYVNASAGEGFGLHLLEAMACGRPLISAPYSGLTMFFDEAVGYAVPYRLVPVCNAIYSGHWAEADEEELIEQMRRVYADQNQARQLGMRAACRAARFPWRNTGRLLRAALVKHGFLR
jgi:glycosyltransferase involved in cell wall biosynthesis